ncbi:hypothetical protein [Endozoicomonas numazuensis]|uniref:Uncharacterized protein n=1 Tax=Endozoicomonas numazuensis TaxID=1137799 RepID=A0A081N6F3_9GAMM|nr:hypothetical protein [Endozoicomonas numazuensis]KEQ14026.1 hypothetical protein GZ78_25645 [Endozoicomonas numazuensis]
MTHPARHFGHFKLFMVIALALMLVTAKSVEANNPKLYTSVGLAIVIVIGGSTLWYNHSSPSENSDFSDDDDTQEHSLQLPVIIYKEEAELNSHHHPGDIRLAPFVNTKSNLLELKGTRSQLRAKTEAAICAPILKVKSVNPTLLKDIHDQCYNWFIKNRMVFPHEFIGIDLNKAVNVVLPELVYSSHHLTFQPYQASLKSDKASKSASTEMNYYQINMTGFKTSEFFKTCYHYPKASGMIPPMMDSGGKLVFQLPKQGVTHLHHDGHAEYFIATDISDNQTKAYFWKLGEPWPKPPKPIWLKEATGELKPVHVLAHE